MTMSCDLTATVGQQHGGSTLIPTVKSYDHRHPLAKLGACWKRHKPSNPRAGIYVKLTVISGDCAPSLAAAPGPIPYSLCNHRQNTSMMAWFVWKESQSSAPGYASKHKLPGPKVCVHFPGARRCSLHKLAFSRRQTLNTPSLSGGRRSHRPVDGFMTVRACAPQRSFADRSLLSATGGV